MKCIAHKFPIFLVIFIFLSPVLAQLRDPTRPVDYTFAPLSADKIVLAAILVQGDHLEAFVNGKWHRMGDQVSGYEITRITRNNVYLADNKGNYMVSLIPAVRRDQ